MSDFAFAVTVLALGLPLTALIIAAGRGRGGPFVFAIVAGFAGFLMPLAGILMGLIAVMAAFTGKSREERELETRRHAEMLAVLSKGGMTPNEARDVLHKDQPATFNRAAPAAPVHHVEPKLYA